MTANARLREIREDLNRLLHEMMELEQAMSRTGRIETPNGFPQRSHTGTWRGRAARMEDIPEEE